MDGTNKIYAKLKKILKKLKGLGIIQTFKLEITFCKIEGNLKKTLVEIDTVLKKCLRKIINKPKRAEIRNIISELVRKKNLSDIDIPNKPVSQNLENKKSCSAEYVNNKVDTLPLKFQCNFCDEIFASRKNFTIHQKMHNNCERFLCEKCGEIFYNVEKWEEHKASYNNEFLLSEDLMNEILIAENENLEMFPETLEVISENLLKEPILEEELENSAQKHDSESLMPAKTEKQFICACGKIFQILKSFKKHERLKHSLKTIKHNCVICGKFFLEKGKLNRHMLSHKEKQYSCLICSKWFSRSDTLKRHISISHYILKEFSCNFCQKKFKLKYNRDIHEVIIHKNVGEWIQCDQCPQKFSNKISLKRHQKTHSKNKITCTVCKKSFTTEGYFKIHMKNKHNSQETTKAGFSGETL